MVMAAQAVLVFNLLFLGLPLIMLAAVVDVDEI
jgi:hypothetical protein